MGTRLQLQALLEALIGSSNVYFQPPENLKMKYPAIVYELDDIQTEFANNQPYSADTRYSLTYMDSDPDSVIPRKIAMLPKCIFDRPYTADNLNHYVYKIFF